MKKSIVLAISLVLLLGCVSNSFASIIWGPKDTSYSFKKGEYWFTDDITMTPAQVAANAIVSVDYSLTGVTSATKTYLTLIQFGTTSGAAEKITTLGSSTGSLSLDIIPNSSGIYKFAVYLREPGTAARAVFSNYTVSNAQTPIPAAALLLGSGVLGLFGVGKARSKKKVTTPEA